MEPGVLRITETSEGEIEATKVCLMVNISSKKLIFGNAAITASEEIKSVVDEIKKISDTVEFEMESVSIQSDSGIFGKNSTATYSLKLTVNDLDSLGSILGICSNEKRVNMNSILWDFNAEKLKLLLVVEAMEKAKNKADQMMSVINYSVVGIRSCSDSYIMPNIGELILSKSRAREDTSSYLARRVDPSPVVDIGDQFKRKKKVSATCTVEFLVAEKT